MKQVHQCNVDFISHYEMQIQSIKYRLEKMLGCFNPNLGQIWTNSNVGLKNVQLRVKVEVGLKF